MRSCEARSSGPSGCGWRCSACLQLGFYVYAYLAAPADARHWVMTSAARLYFHLVPAVLVLRVAAVERWFHQRGIDATIPISNGPRS